MGAQRCDQDWLGGRALWLEQTGGRAQRLGKTWKVAAQENAFGKVPNPHIGDPHHLDISLRDPQILIGDPQILIGDPQIFIEHPNFFIGDPQIFI